MASLVELFVAKGEFGKEILSPPLLFVLAADLLQTVINNAASDQLLRHPLGDEFGGDFPIIHYADDTLLILPADSSQLTNLKQLLNTFAISTGLKVNYGKSSMVPINVDPMKMVELAQVFGCQIVQMPFTYLGLPLGTTRPSVIEFMPILNRMERHLMGISRMLTYAGRLILVNSIYSSMPTFYMCTLKLPIEILDQIERYSKYCLWNGGDLSKKGGCLVAWTQACRSKEEGGLGIINLRTNNTALLLKYLYKFYSKAELPWVQLTWQKLYRNGTRPPHLRKNVGSFWWRDIISLSQHFFMLATCNIHNGDTVSFWKDLWDPGVLQWRFPQLFSFTKQPNISARKFLSSDINENFRLPLSMEAFNQLVDLTHLLETLDTSGHHQDVWTFIWGSNTFTSKQAYDVLRGTLPASLFKWMWKSRARNHHKFFFWLLLRDRLNCRNLLRRKNMHLDCYNCAVCVGNTEETIMHIFFDCPFSQACWIFLGIQWNLTLPPLDMIITTTNFWVSNLLRDYYCGCLGYLDP